jgi:myo-inositol-1-phosphate synthase
MGRVLDGVADHMDEMEDDRTFLLADAPEPSKEEVVEVLRETRADVLLNYLPVGSQEATEFYAECALEAGVALVNNIPVFIASEPAWAARFEAAGVPIIGDDIKAQLGATIVHRVLTDLFRKRGVKLERTYQLNTGGNHRLPQHEGTQPAQVQEDQQDRGGAVGRRPPSGRRQHPRRPVDYVAWQNDNKVCFLRMEGPDVRRRADEPGAAPVGRGQPQFGRRRHRHDPLRKAGEGSRHRRPDPPGQRLFLQAPARADDR